MRQTGLPHTTSSPSPSRTGTYIDRRRQRWRTVSAGDGIKPLELVGTGWLHVLTSRTLEQPSV